MATEYTVSIEAPTSTNGNAKKPTPKMGKQTKPGDTARAASARKGGSPVTKKPAAKVEKKTAPTKKITAKNKARDGSLRGVAKPANWKPAKTMRGYDPAEPISHRNRLKAPQIRILTMLAKAKAPLLRAKIAETCSIDPTWVGVWVGRTDPIKRAASEAKWGYTSLLTLGFAKQKELKVDDKDVVVYEITGPGCKALEKHEKADKAKK